MKLQGLLFALFLTCSFLFSCGNAAEQKTDAKDGDADTKTTETKTPTKDDTAPAPSTDGDTDELILETMLDYLKDAADGQIPVPEILRTEGASWEDKVGKLMNDTGVAKKLKELGDTPEEIVKKITEMATK